MKPPPKLTVSQWADQFRKLSSESSAEPGQWRTSRNEPMRGVMDALNEPLTHTVISMTSSQVGKTEAINNAIGFFMSQDPSPILLMQPTTQMGESWSTERFAPMIRDTPVLRGLVGDARSRDSGNKILHKSFRGGYLAVTGANSPASLAMRPVRFVACDEIDRYPASAGDEGDPVSLALVRSKRFHNRKAFLASTPTIKGFSRIESLYEGSDKRIYRVPCPHCGKFQRLVWSNVKWPEGNPEGAYYECERCAKPWTDGERWRMIRKGHWIATAPYDGVAGFHLSEIYSSWTVLGDMAKAFLQAKRNVETLKAFVNTSLGETWESETDRISPHQFLDRLEKWDKAPKGVLVVTCGVDVQFDRIEIERVGWGIDDESWSLDHHVIHVDPSSPEAWRQLDVYLSTPTIREDDKELPVRTTCIDSGGQFTQTVYRWCKPRRHRRIFAVKGRDDPTTVWPQGLRARKQTISDVVIVGTNVAKDGVYSRLRIKQPGPGFCHFPVGRPHAWFEQLTSEVIETKYVKGFPKRVWKLPDGKRNEALDCRVYAFAALQSMSIKWPVESANVAAMPSKADVVKPVEIPKEVVAAKEVQKLREQKPSPYTRSGSGWLQKRGGWIRR